MKIILISICLVVLFSCSSKTGTENNAPAADTSVQSKNKNPNIVELTSAQLQTAGITTVKAEKRSIPTTLKVSGAIDVPPQNMVSVSVPMGGYLKSTKLLPGMHVAKGESIAVVEDQQYIQLQQDYLTTQAKLAYAVSEYNRQKELNQSKATSDKQFQQTEAEYKNQQIIAASLSQKLKLVGINPLHLTSSNITRGIHIYSPINGYVTKVNVNIGKYVNPSDVLFEIVDPSDIHLALNIFEKDINKLRIGQQLQAYTNNDPSNKYVCKIVLIGKELSAERDVEVHCHFENYDSKLIPGMFMNAEIQIENDSSYTLPTEAIVNYESKYFVFSVKSNSQYKMLEVKTGNEENGFTAINLNDTTLYQNAVFVTKGAYSLLMKMKNTGEDE